MSVEYKYQTQRLARSMLESHIKQLDYELQISIPRQKSRADTNLLVV